VGASGWDYVVPYQEDLGAALDVLRRQVFASGEYLKPSFYGDVFDLPEPGSVDDLFEQEQYWEFANSERLYEYVTGGRWTGRTAVLWADGAPAEIAFWGYSGD